MRAVLRSRSLLANSTSSVIASAILIVSTVVTPGLLARLLQAHEFAIYSTLMATLPLLSLLPQTVRSGAASQLALAYARDPVPRVNATYCWLILAIALALMGLSLASFELYIRFDQTYATSLTYLRLGFICLLLHVLGMLAAIVVTGPASAHQDFLPENVAKFWPGLFMVAGLIAVYWIRPREPLPWIFGVLSLSTWTIAAWLLFRLRAEVFDLTSRRIDWFLLSRLWRGVSGLVWWNLTAWLATTAAVLIVAVFHPRSIVPFSIAVSATGITAAGLIAIAAPISARVAARAADGSVRTFFLRVNSLFQAYVFLTAAVLCMTPRWMFELWVGPDLAGDVKLFCLMLLPSYALRLLTMAFTVFVMGVGRQHTLWFSPMVEAAVAIIGSLIFGSFMGVVGIPAALALSAAVRLVLTLLHDVRLNAEALSLRRSDVLLSAFRLGRACRC